MSEGSPRAVFAKRLSKEEKVAKNGISPLKKLSAHFSLCKSAKSGGTAFPRPDIQAVAFLFVINKYFYRKRGSEK